MIKKIGILGLGNKTKAFLAFLKKSKNYEISGIYDSNKENLLKIAGNSNLKYTENPFGLISQSDLLIISKTDENSYNLIVESILNSKHVIIENPSNISIKEFEELNKLAAEASVSVIPYLPYRFNDYLMNIKSEANGSSYINIAYSQNTKHEIIFSGNSELLLNLIDFTLCFDKANVKRVNTDVIKVSGEFPQIIIIRIEFDNGSIACINIDCVSSRNDFLINIYQPKKIFNINMIKNISITKTFNNEDILKYKTKKQIFSNELNIHEGIINYLNTLETSNSPLNLTENFKNSLFVLKKVEDKIAH